ncbi:hypothetical protein Tco_0755838 [Tanacetum coccineum]
MKHSYSNDDTCFSIDVIDEILEEDFDALLNEGSKILHSIKGTLLKKEIFAEFDEFMAMTANENSDLNLIPKNHHSRKSPSIQIKLLDDKKPAVQKQRRLNPNMQEVVKKETVKLLDTETLERHLFKKEDAKPPEPYTLDLTPTHEFPDIKSQTEKEQQMLACHMITHLSRIENDETSDDSEVDDNFPGETLMEINTKDEPYSARLWQNYLAR